MRRVAKALLLVSVVVMGALLALVQCRSDDAADEPIAPAEEHSAPVDEPIAPSEERSAPTDPSCDLVLVGKTKRVLDGDTIEVVLDSGPIKVRFASVDAPEDKGDQPYNKEATALLRTLVDGKEVQLCVETQDRFSRLVASVYVGDLYVNGELVRQGSAWAYNDRDYLVDKNLLVVEEEARCAQRGLWAEPAVRPWEWRRGGRHAERYGCNGQADGPLGETTARPFECGTKHTCGEMKSCEEATLYLKQCGLTGLDGNHDGVPCAALCR